ncbi:MAG: bacteriohemerythrin [Acidobacteriota bacterium]
MPLFAWRPEYALNIPRVDKEHQMLFAAGARLHKALVTGKSGPMLDALIDELAEYGRVHFSHEEQFMMEIRYPRMLAHKVEHQSFIQKVDRFHEAAANGDRTLALGMLQFLHGWLVRHIGHSDVQVREHFLHMQPEPTTTPSPNG